jgi:hypothetical protein
MNLVETATDRCCGKTLGTGLHGVQDSYPHAPYPWGHREKWVDDETHRDSALPWQMTQTTTKAILENFARCCRWSDGENRFRHR